MNWKSYLKGQINGRINKNKSRIFEDCLDVYEDIVQNDSKKITFRIWK